MFWQKAPHPLENFNLKKSREKIPLERHDDKLSMFQCVMGIFTIFDEFLPYFPFSCQFQLFLNNFMQNSETFSELRAIYSFFCAIWKWKDSGASRQLKDAMKIFTDAGKKTGKKLACFFLRKRKIWNFWPKYLPVACPLI